MFFLFVYTIIFTNLIINTKFLSFLKIFNQILSKMNKFYLKIIIKIKLICSVKKNTLNVLLGF